MGFLGKGRGNGKNCAKNQTQIFVTHLLYFQKSQVGPSFCDGLLEIRIFQIKCIREGKMLPYLSKNYQLKLMKSNYFFCRTGLLEEKIQKTFSFLILKMFRCIPK